MTPQPWPWESTLDLAALACAAAGTVIFAWKDRPSRRNARPANAARTAFVARVRVGRTARKSRR